MKGGCLFCQKKINNQVIKGDIQNMNYYDDDDDDVYIFTQVFVMIN